MFGYGRLVQALTQICVTDLGLGVHSDAAAAGQSMAASVMVRTSLATRGEMKAPLRPSDRVKWQAVAINSSSRRQIKAGCP
ncbi:unnamed protein product [Phytophthora fragariaefolia]|uniref:Unnamed protein product n=1 Tax=Phytophthora fragariaefolia TaxID=1490495 RepID=A0A9W6XHZ2_9STRA|nr:unnamed protein product [Phytophthora fragariaefolia]